MRRCVAQVAALGDLGDEGTEGDNRGGSQSDFLCQGTPVGSKASQPVLPREDQDFVIYIQRLAQEQGPAIP